MSGHKEDRACCHEALIDSSRGADIRYNCPNLSQVIHSRPMGHLAMPQYDEILNAMRKAVEAAPDNIAIREQFAVLLREAGELEEAEREFRAALALSPDNIQLKLQLAKSFMAQRKWSHALVIVEDVLRIAIPPALCFILHAELLFELGEAERSIEQYRAAIQKDPALANPELAENLGIDAKTGLADYRDELVEGKVRASWDDGSESNSRIERSSFTFKDVGGMDTVKEDIAMKIIFPIKHPEMFEAYGKAAGGGILLYGPPGCGKTLLAKATAGEIDAGFISVGINDVVDMWIGNSEKNLHSYFERARENKPCVLFFDEVDALGSSRSEMRASGGRQLINQFLSEMDGMQGQNDGLLILAATNAPWHMDTAFRRPGRFDRILFVPPPDLAARIDILRIHCSNKPTQSLDLESIAKKTEGFSGADLRGIVETAIEAKLKQAMKVGKIQPITTPDLLTAAKAAKPTTKDWFSTARNHALYANQGGYYDDILKYLKI